MPITPSDQIWMNGDLVPWDEARIHVLTHTLHYGNGVFEGIRAYETSDGPAIFRLTPHIERLFRSAKIFMLDIPYTPEQLVEATKETVSRLADPVTVRAYFTKDLPPPFSTNARYVGDLLEEFFAPVALEVF